MDQFIRRVRDHLDTQHGDFFASYSSFRPLTATGPASGSADVQSQLYFLWNSATGRDVALGHLAPYINIENDL